MTLAQIQYSAKSEIFVFPETSDKFSRSHVREITERWVSEYNCERPHESLNNMTPEEYRQHNHLAGISKNAWN
ncbi:transposase [Salmonella enterica]|uniref:transposase n=1 Tax=Salmonella enterica TaxID=28901 RepID=UPI0021C46AE2|nr:transposase [Salmonella enterica]